MRIPGAALLLCLLLCGCQYFTEEQKLVQHFKNAADTLVSNTRQTKKGLEHAYAEVKRTKGKLSMVGRKADSTFMILEVANHFFDSLKLVTEAATGDNANGTSPKVMSDPRTEKAIDAMLLRVRNTCNASLMDKSKKHGIDSVLKQELGYTRQKGWAKTEFGNVPGHVSITQLNAMKKHCEDAATLTMEDLDKAGKKK